MSVQEVKQVEAHFSFKFLGKRCKKENFLETFNFVLGNLMNSVQERTEYLLTQEYIFYFQFNEFPFYRKITTYFITKLKLTQISYSFKSTKTK